MGDAIVADAAITFDVFRPFLRFGNLTGLTISPRRGLSWDDEALNEISQCFSRMRSLNLGADYGCRDQSRITLAGLVPLLKNCPELSWLGIVIDTSVLPPAKEKPGGEEGIFNDHTNRLYLGDSKVDDTVRVVSFLSDIFPNLEHIITWLASMNDRPLEQATYGSRWHEVAHLARAFIDVREQEATWRGWKSEDTDMGSDNYSSNSWSVLHDHRSNNRS